MFVRRGVRDVAPSRPTFGGIDACRVGNATARLGLDRRGAEIPEDTRWTQLRRPREPPKRSRPGGAGSGGYFRTVSGTKVGGLGGLTASFSTLNTRWSMGEEVTKSA